MQAIGVDLGGTKLQAALFSRSGEILADRTVLLEGRTGKQVAELIVTVCDMLMEEQEIPPEKEKKNRYLRSRDRRQSYQQGMGS